MSVRSLSIVATLGVVGVLGVLPLSASAVEKPAGGGSTTVPASLQPPAGNVAAFDMDGVGVQTYECVNSAWAPAGPAANLLKNGTSVGIHYRSASGAPAWQSTKDGSTVTATVVASAPSDNSGSVAQLLLKANFNNGGAGSKFGDVTYIQRLDTKGGLAPAGACDASVTPRTSTPYTTVYRFFKAA